MSSFLEFGKTTIKVPNKMIFVNKQGYDNLTNPVTKTGAIASRFGIKSLNVQPSEGDKIEVIESAPREVIPKPKAPPKPRTKKSNNKKEYLTSMKRVSKKFIKPEEPKINEIINEWDSSTLPILLSQQDPEVYNNIEKKVNQLNKKNQYIVIGELGFYIKKYIDNLFKHYGENKEAVQTIINGLETIVEYMGGESVKQGTYQGLLKWVNASNADKIFKLFNGANSSLKIVKKEPEESEDTISAKLQKLIYTSSIDKIKKSLNDLKYKGRMNTNKVLLNMQLLQNLDTNKQKELIKLLE